MEQEPEAAEGFRSYTPAHTPEQIVGLLAEELSAEVEWLQRVDLGVINAVYEARLANGLDCFVKVAPASRGHHTLAQEVWAFERCRRVGVPAPEVLAFRPEPGAFPEPYHITRRLPGENGERVRLTAEQRHDAFRQLGSYLARIHRVTLHGFGLLERCGDGFGGQHPTVWENLVAVLDARWWREPLLAVGLVNEAELHALRTRFEQEGELFRTARACLVWADGGLKNVLIEGGMLVGVVDMENVVAGEPVNDFDALHYDTEEDLAAVKDGYESPALFDAAFERKRQLYRLLFAYPTLAQHHRRGNTARVAEMRDRIRQLQASLGR
jgi:aminoglycoside phosphotransferase (APT) family kinase protein